MPNDYIHPILSANPVEETSLKQYIVQHMSICSQTYASTMPDWAAAEYFDPEAQKKRVAIHDYQQTEIREMRRVDNTKLVDSLKLPLKSYNDVLQLSDIY